MERNFQIVVVGAGLVGKACALALGRQGLRVALVAAAASAEQADRVYALSASTRALLDDLRVWQALDPAALTPVSEMHIRGDAAQRRGAIDFSAYESGHHALAWITTAGLVDAGLDTALRFAQSVTVITGELHALRTDGEAAELTLADGSVLRAACVVGADGARSRVRDGAGIAMDARPYGQTAVVANFSVARPHHGVARQWFLGPTSPGADGRVVGEVLALLPMPGDCVSLVWSATEAHAEALLAMDGAALARAVDAVHDGEVARLTGGLTHVGAPARGFPLALRRAAALVAPRVALVGDAAHVIHPLAGQGVNLGLRDVAELARVVAAKEPFRDLGDARLLRRYARARQADIAAIVAATDGLQTLFSQPGPAPALIRNLGMRMVDALPPLKQFLVRRALA